jgi:DNA-binding phage protein
MEFQLKTLSPEAIDRALARAERYRLLNEPGEAQSICLDALAIQPDNQAALTTLLLALTEQFDEDSSYVADAWATVARFRDEYERAYYTGLVHERRAKALRRHGRPGSASRAYEWLRSAMTSYESAEAIRPPGNDDALLRWNACARLIMRDHHLVPITEERAEPLLLE